MEIEEEALPQNKGTSTVVMKGSKTAKSGSKRSKDTSSAGSEKTMPTQPEKRRSLAVEEKYQKMTQREHIIKRPDTYSKLYFFCLMFSWFC